MYYIRFLLFSDAPNSSIARFFRRVNNENTPDQPIIKNNNRIQKTLSKYKNSVPDQVGLVPEILSDAEVYLEIIFQTHDLNLNGLNFLSEDLKDFYENCVKTDEQKSLSINKKTLPQNNIYWKEERRLRITASQCYSLFTYTKNKKPDWDKKISSYINPKPFKSFATDYGKNSEKKAFNAYEFQTGYSVSNMGLVINPSASWLACSPDGVDINRNVLIEIKCPVLGASQNLKELLPNLKTFLFLEGDQYRLKPNHIYYGQIQLSMFILNIEKCDFLVYSQTEDKCEIIPVKKDDIFLQKLIPALKHVYETYVLIHLERIMREKKNRESFDF